MARMLVLLPLLILVGCGESDGVKRLTVTGTVTFQGKPLTDGGISFEDPTTGYAAASQFQDGAFQVQLPVGEYKVMIEPTMVEVPSRDGNSPPSQRPSVDLPRKYFSAATTDLKAKVADDSTNFAFDLKK
ncbi:hypothetical protein [Blastopirellula retiformator]|uniref:Carboxypeptidase regulatory-like domain-containing protein n=1 Tax=Blastopirellula retiformator TaxID=2527970 RepID=A0A5C5VP82_9BACT|nr:hypothetical protein [Blastopirellula retiformator]TWT39735.1 hypothetical protein Enr8_14360 [Blastopirellula retiformator]